MRILGEIPGVVIAVVAAVVVIAVFIFSSSGMGKMVKTSSDKATSTMTSTLDTLDGKISGAAGSLQ